MSSINLNSLSRKLSAAASVAVLAAGILAAPMAFASDNGHHGDDDRSVTISNVDYSVQHDGNGPYVEVNGTKYYLEGSGDSSRFVMVNGKKYSVMGHESDNGNDNHHHDWNDDRD